MAIFPLIGRNGGRGFAPIAKGGGVPGAASPATTPAACNVPTTAQAPRANLQKPFVVASNVVVAAGAQAINTTLADAFLAANVDFIATNNVFPYDVQTFGICTLVSGNMAASYIETQAVLANLYYVESDQTGELGRWAYLTTGLLLGIAGVVTSGAVGHSAYYGPEVFQEWRRYYPNGSTQFLTTQTTTAFTSVGAINLGVCFPAKR